MKIFDAILSFFAAIERALCAAELGMNGVAVDPPQARVDNER